MDNSAVEPEEIVLEYEKPGEPKCFNDKSQLLPYDKRSISGISSNFMVQEDMNESNLIIDLNQGYKLVLVDPNEEILNTHNEAESQEKKIQWDGPATKLLLSLYKQKEPLVGSHKFKNKRKMWENIAKKMKEVGYPFTALQAENRVKTLLRSYKKAHHYENSSTRPRKQCSYEDELNAIYDLKDVSKLGNVEIQFEQDDSNQSVESEHTQQDEDPLNTIGNSDHTYQTTKKVDWDDLATTLLLKLYKQKRVLCEARRFKTKKQMWEDIASEINKKNYGYSGSQVENRFKTMLRAYRKVLEGGDRSKFWPYRDELDTLFVEDDDMLANVIPSQQRLSFKKTVSERLGLAIVNIKERNDSESDNDVDLFEETKDDIQTDKSDDVLQEIRNVLENSEMQAAQRHLEVMKVLKDMNQIQQKRNELFEKYLDMQMKK